MGTYLMGGYPFKVCCARIVGRSHTATQTPCQDFVVAESSRDFACLALADGAGSRKRAELGAEVCTKTVAKLFRQDFDQLSAQALVTPDLLAQTIVNACLESMQQKADQSGCAVYDMACTLMFVACRGGRFVAGHIGDGVILYRDDQRQVQVLSHPENGEYANTTTFITEPRAASRLRIVTGESSSPAFVVMSDGTAESLYLRSTRQPAVAAVEKLLQWNADMPRTRMARILDANLSQMFVRKSSDDCSIGLMGAVGDFPLGTVTHSP